MAASLQSRSQAKRGWSFYALAGFFTRAGFRPSQQLAFARQVD